MELCYIYYIGDQQIYYGLYIAINEYASFRILVDTLDESLSRIGTATDLPLKSDISSSIIPTSSSLLIPQIFIHSPQEISFAIAPHDALADADSISAGSLYITALSSHLALT